MWGRGGGEGPCEGKGGPEGPCEGYGGGFVGEGTAWRVGCEGGHGGGRGCPVQGRVVWEGRVAVMG